MNEQQEHSNVVIKIPAEPAGSSIWGAIRAGNPFGIRGKSPLRYLLIAAVSVTLICLIIATALIIQQHMLGYHTSPGQLAAGITKSIETQDNALLYSFVHTDDYITVTPIPPALEVEFVDIITGSQGQIAYILTKQDKREFFITAYRRSGRWYLRPDGVETLLSDTSPKASS